jgi:hypothetical protein
VILGPTRGQYKVGRAALIQSRNPQEIYTNNWT